MTSCSRILLLAVAAVPAVAQTAALGRTGANGTIRFEVIEDFLIGGSRKVRLMPDNTESLDAAAFKKLPRVDLGQAGVLRADSSGHIVRLNGKGTPPDIVLPDNLQLKAAIPAKSAQGRLAIEVISSKKAKQRDTLAPEDFFLYIAASEPDRAVFDFINEDWAFQNLDERFRVMKGFVDSFPNSPSKDALRLLLDQRVAQGIAAFDDGGPYQDLLTTRRFAAAACELFPAVERLAKLRDGIEQRIHFVEEFIALLRSLAISAYWDAFLDVYPKFEPYQWSFADLQRLRARSLEESARIHADRARAFQTRGDHESSIREFRLALRRDPSNETLNRLRDAEQLLAAQNEARRTASSRKRLAPDSPEGVRFQRALDFASRAVQEKKFDNARQSIAEAERENKDAPQIVLAKAQLLAAEGKLRASLELLDQYDRIATGAAERNPGEALRNQVLYDLASKRDAARRAVTADIEKGDFLQAAQILTGILAADDRDPDILYLAGTVSAALRGKDARTALVRYLELSDNLSGDLKRRDTARRVLAILDAPAPAAAASGSSNWMSGRKLTAGVYYCPSSLAFQTPIDSITGFKLKMNFEWKGGRLNAITSTFDDEKGRQNYLALNSSPAPDGETGNFYFDYFADGPMRSVRTKKAPPAAVGGFRLVRDRGAAHLLDSDGQPRLLLPGDPVVNPDVLGLLEAPVFTLVSGNSYFNPFIWDGVHYFSARYDDHGRVDSAKEWGADNILRFSWEGDRLSEIRAYRKDSDTHHYRRVITYSGQKIISEEYTGPGKGGQIKYLTDTEVKVEDHGVHDGRVWTARLAGGN